MQLWLKKSAWIPVAFALLAALPARAGQAPERELIVWLRDDAALAELLNSIPPRTELLFRYAQAMVLRAPSEAEARRLQARLAANPAFAEVRRNFRVTTRQSPTCLEAQSAAPRVPAEALAQAAARRLGCDLSSSETCPGTGAPKLWAQERMGADLAFQEFPELATYSTNRPHAKVAVIDTGFDPSQSANVTNMRYGESVSVRMGRSLAVTGQSNRDLNGHGTAVAGTIVGRNGVGVAPGAELTSYRITQGAAGESNQALVEQSIWQACEDGNQVINVSWGSLEDERGDPGVEDISPELQNALSAQGCLVVKAAGNSGYRNRAFGEADLDNPVLRVQASDFDGKTAQFSSSGEVSAPGTGVYSLAGRQASEPMGFRCGSGSGALVDGTSFASPLVAGVASDIIQILSEGSAYGRLAPPDRIGLVNRIIASSQVAGSVNLLRALHIARNWNRVGTPDLNSSGLEALLTQPLDPRCRQAQPACDSDAACGTLKACVKQERERVAICPDQASSSIANLYRVSRDNGNYHQAMDWQRALPDRSADSQESGDLLDHFENQWAGGAADADDRAARIRQNLEFRVALELLLRETENLPPGSRVEIVIADPLQDMFGSDDFDRHFAPTRDADDQDDDTAQLINVLEATRAKLGDDRQFETLYQSLMQKALRAHPANRRNIARLADRIHQKAQGKRRGASARDPYQGLFAALAMDGASQGDLSFLCRRGVSALLSEPGLLSAADRKRFARAVIATIRKGHGWGRSADPQLLRQARKLSR